MSRYRGIVRGGRGEASRLGHRSLVTECNSWTAGVRVEATPDGDGDTFRIYATTGSSPEGRSQLIASIGANGLTRIYDHEEEGIATIDASF